MAKRKSLPQVHILGKLPPTPALLEQVMREQTELNDFTGGAPVPAPLRALMREHGYETNEGGGMLFAHNAGVGIHTDQEPTILWILCGTSCSRYMSSPSHELIVAGEVTKLEDGMVLWFDAQQPHGVIAQTNSLWACYSIYCKEAK